MLAPSINRKKGLYCHETSFSKSAGNFSCAHFLKGPKPRTGTYRAERWKGMWGETNSTSISPTFAATFPLRENFGWVGFAHLQWRNRGAAKLHVVARSFDAILRKSTLVSFFQFQDVKTGALFRTSMKSQLTNKSFSPQSGIFHRRLNSNKLLFVVRS